MMKQIGIALIVLAIASAAKAQQKRDIQGATPGMTQEQIKQLFGGDCTPFLGSLSCKNTVYNRFVIGFTKNSSVPLATLVRYYFCTRESFDAAARTVLRAFGREQDVTIRSAIVDVRIDDKVRLEIRVGHDMFAGCPLGLTGYVAELKDENLSQTDQEAGSPDPTSPRF